MTMNELKSQQSLIFTAGMFPAGIPAVDTAVSTTFRTDFCRFSHFDRTGLVAINATEAITGMAGYCFVFNLFGIFCFFALCGICHIFISSSVHIICFSTVAGTAGFKNAFHYLARTGKPGTFTGTDTDHLRTYTPVPECLFE